MIAAELSAVLSGVDARQFDFWEGLADEDPGKAPEVNVLSVSEASAVELADDLTRAGLTCEVLDGLPLALARAVAMAQSGPETGPAAVLDWGYASSTFCIVGQGRPLFTRHLRDNGSGQLIERVGQALGLTEEESQQVLATHGVPGGRDDARHLQEVQEVIADVVSGPLSEMVDQLARTLSYLAVHRTRLVPQRLWLMGGGATVRNMAAFLNAKTGIACGVWRTSIDGEGSPGAFPPELLGPAIALSALGWAQ